MVDVSVIVVSHNTRGLLAECLQSVPEAAAPLAVELWVIDNASSDGSADMVAADFPAAHLIRNPDNLGFAAGNNQALRDAAGQFLLLLNSDARLSPGCLPTLVAVMTQQPEIGICGPALFNPDGSRQPSWGDFPNPRQEFLFQSLLFKVWPTRFAYNRRVHPLLRPAYRRLQWVDWVTGAAFLLRRAVYARLGDLPEDSFMYGEDLEYCARARQAGFRVAYVPIAQAVHHLQVSSRRDFARWIENYTRSTLLYYQRHRPPTERRQVARLIIAGSRLRQAACVVLEHLLPARAGEARARRQGYARAIALARQCLVPGGDPRS